MSRERRRRGELDLHNAGKDAFVVVGAELSEDRGERVDVRSRKHSAGDVDHLKICSDMCQDRSSGPGSGTRGWRTFCPGQGSDDTRLGSDIVGDRGLEPRDLLHGGKHSLTRGVGATDQEVSAFIVHLWPHAMKSSVLDGPVSTIDWDRKSTIQLIASLCGGETYR